MSDQKSWTMDDSALASTPGQIKLQPIRYFVNYPLWPCLWMAGLLIALVLALLLHWSLWILFAIFAGINWFYWQQRREHFLYGNMTPSIIVSVEPMMFATLTDLTHGAGSYHAIKIIQKRFSSVMGKTPQVGSMFPSVSTYEESMDESKPHWETFHPVPVECATGDPTSINKAVKKFSKKDWQELKLFLKKVPRPFKPGLYHLK